MKFLHLQGKDLSWRTLRTHLAADKKRVLALLLCAAAVLLLLLSVQFEKQPAVQTEEAPDTEQYVRQLETRLAELIAAIDGAGKTKVLVTLRSGTETVYARDDKLESEKTADSTRTESEQAYVLLGSGSNETGLELKTVAPQIQGVAVVCTGADVPQVRQRITETVTAALGIGAAHVSVVKMKSERN